MANIILGDSHDFVTADFCSSFIQKQRWTGAEMVCGQTQLFQDGKYGRISPSPMGLFSGEVICYPQVGHWGINDKER